MSSPGTDPPRGEVAAEVPVRLSDDLVARVLDRHGYVYTVLPGGGVEGRWGDDLIRFIRAGAARDVLRVRTTAARVFDIDAVPRLYAFCNTWNAGHLWPKAYVHVDDAGRARVRGEVVAHLARGVTADQLDRLLGCGIVHGCRLSDAVAELAG
jgi:putative sensory transduction regulator